MIGGGRTAAGNRKNNTAQTKNDKPDNRLASELGPEQPTRDQVVDNKSDDWMKKLAEKAEVARSQARQNSRKVKERGINASIRRGDKDRLGHIDVLAEDVISEADGCRNSNNPIPMAGESAELFTDAPMSTQPNTQDFVSNTMPPNIKVFCTEASDLAGISETLTPTPHVTNNPIDLTTTLASSPSLNSQIAPSNPSSNPLNAHITGPSVTEKGAHITAPMPASRRKPRRSVVSIPRCRKPTLPSVSVDPEAEFEAQGDPDLGYRPWWMQGGPKFGTVLLSYPTHIARYIWSGSPIEMTRKYVHAHTRPLDFLDLHDHIVEGPEGWWSIAHRSGLTALAELEYGTVDHQLISAFVEHWHPETNSFHFSWGEITITLHDVAIIMGLPIEGEEMIKLMEDAPLRNRICEMFGYSLGELLAYTNGGGITIAEAVEHVKKLIADGASQSDIASAYLLLLVGSTIFVDRSTKAVKHKYMQFLLDHGKIGNFAWGAATLALLYRNLGQASRAQTAGMGGCMKLLQCWIWRYFPRFCGNTSHDPNKLSDKRAAAADEPRHNRITDPRRLVELRKVLDGIRVEEVCWMPWKEIGQDNVESLEPLVDFKNIHKSSRFEGIITCLNVQEPYMPSRVTRQFGRKQGIPPLPIEPTIANRPISAISYKVEFKGPDFSTWANRDNNLIDIEGMERCKWPWDCDSFYLNYHLDITHPYVDPTSPQQSHPQDGPPIPIPRASDAIARIQTATGMVRTFLDKDGISIEEKNNLDCILQVLTGDSIPNIFMNSGQVDNQSSHTSGSGDTEDTNEVDQNSRESENGA